MLNCATVSVRGLFLPELRVLPAAMDKCQTLVGSDLNTELL
jgi:hypothetical protein